MATNVKVRKKRSPSRSRKFRQAVLGKPNGNIQPRVQQVGPELQNTCPPKLKQGSATFRPDQEF